MQHLQLQKFGILETMGKTSWSLLLLNRRAPSVLNCAKEPGAKLSAEVNSKSSLVYSSFVFLWSLSEEVRTVPSCWIWIMKVLQILWDFLSQLLDERGLQTSPHQMLVLEITNCIPETRRHKWRWTGFCLSLDPGRVKLNILFQALPMQKLLLFHWNFSSFFFFSLLLEKVSTEYSQGWELQEVRGEILCCTHNKLSN